MLKPFLLLLVITGIFTPGSLASDAMSGACLPYTQDIQSGKNTRLRSSIPYGEGLLWKISGKDGSNGYLFGTIHSQDRRATSLPPEVRLALVKSRKLVLEVVPDQQANLIFNESIYFKDGGNLENMLATDIYNRLAKLAPDYGIPAEKTAELKPWAAFTLIGRPKPVRAATQEMVLMQIADNAGKPVASLESMAELVGSLETISPADQIIILNDTVCNYRKIIRQTRDLLDMYVARDLAGMVIFNEQPHFDEEVFDRFMQILLYDRNDKIISRIEEYMKEGNAFIAIGAMHLPGERGLLKLLEKRGYSISRVY